MANEIISVIAPVYNVNVFLECFIKSILEQTYKNFELILITDAPTDGSDRTCDKFAELDKRIQVLHQPYNMGVSKARNRGLREATGKYIMFADSDDYLSNDALMYSKTQIEHTKTDIAVCGLCTDIEGVRRQIAYRKYKSFYTRSEAIIAFLNCHTLSGYSCSKLYRKTILDKIFFPEDMSFGEDGVFCLRAYNKAYAGVSFSPRPIYNYRIRKDSLSGHGEEFSKRDLETIKQIEYARNIIEPEKYKKELNIFEFLSYSGMLSKYKKASNDVQQQYREEYEKLKKACDICWKDCLFYAINPKHRMKALQYGIKMIVC